MKSKFQRSKNSENLLQQIAAITIKKFSFCKGGGILGLLVDRKISIEKSHDYIFSLQVGRKIKMYLPFLYEAFIPIQDEYRKSNLPFQK